MSKLSIQERTWIFIAYILLVYLAYSVLVVEAVWVPNGGGVDLWFLSVVGLAAVRLIETPFFRKPTDTLLASLTSASGLWALELPISLASGFVGYLRSTSILYMGVMFAASVASISLLRAEKERPRLRQLVYRGSTRLGTPELLFTPAVLVSLLAYHDVGTPEGSALLGFWILMTVVRPIEELLLLFKQLRGQESADSGRIVGTVERIDAPNLLRVLLRHPDKWDAGRVLVARLPLGTKVLVLPLFHQVRDDGILGTGLACGPTDIPIGMAPGIVSVHEDCPNRDQVLAQILGEEGTSSSLVGFVVEDSNISRIKFEITVDTGLREGLVVFCIVDGRRIYYQIVSARTSEESFERNPRGTLWVTATQLGMPSTERGFERYPWVPTMNTPVFMPSDLPRLDSADAEEDDLDVGVIPGTMFPARVEFDKLAEFHGAVLGITGMGKTELAFDLIREGIKSSAKIICVDFTGEYRQRLSDLDPVDLGLHPTRIAELETLVNAVETGEYSAADEKKALSKFMKETHPDVAEQVADFLESDGPGLALFELEEIANTRATLRATEVYLSEVFRWARDHRRARQVLLVLEEAHTIIPEFNLFGFDRSDTAAVVGRLSQIALQGRKYGVGILLVSQRTALVSKTVLSQCNTHFCFSLVDKTSLEYMANVFGEDHLEMIPNLRSRQLIAYGPGIRSEKPIMVEIPFDPEKKAASDELDFKAEEGRLVDIVEIETSLDDTQDEDCPF